MCMPNFRIVHGGDEGVLNLLSSWLCFSAGA